MISSTARAFAVVVATTATLLGLAGTATAAPTSIPKNLTRVAVNAAPGTVNQVTIIYGVVETFPDGYVRDAHFITDTAGLVVTPGEGQICSQPIENTSACSDTTTTAGVPPGTTGAGESPSIRLGNRADTLTSDNVGSLEVLGGSGNDRMIGGSRPILTAVFIGDPVEVDSSVETFEGEAGNDFLKGNGDDDVLVGGRGRDTLLGGPGSDLLDAKDGHRDKRIDCGPGKGDRAFVDDNDPKPISC